MVAPLVTTGDPPTAALWFLAMDARGAHGRKESYAIDRLHARADPFELTIGAATLTETGTAGSFGDVAWDLHWTPGARGYEHVHPLLRHPAIAKTILTLPEPDLSIDGAISFADTRLELSGARGGQAHLWGSKHAQRWAWAHCNDFDGAGDSFVDGVSVIVARGAREIGPSTPVVGRIEGREFRSRSPLRVLSNRSSYSVTGWRFEAVAARLKLVGEVEADRGSIAGVTYHDPDGQLAYCYNSEIATMNLDVYERARPLARWTHLRTLVAPGRAHFEYAQRTPIQGLELHVR
jgi:hypothetical protein